MSATAVFLVCVLALSAAAPPTDSEWQNFKAKYGKSYQADEDDMRRAIFSDNLKFAREHSTDQATLGVTQFSDLTNDEFRMIHASSAARGFRVSDDLEEAIEVKAIRAPPTSLDWRQQNAVTPVQDQGQCGSSPYFAGMGAVEGAHAIASGKLEELSIQQIIDCSQDGSSGCNGGSIESVYSYIIKNGGIASKKAYPYHARQQKCNTTAEKIHSASITGYKKVKTGSEKALLAAVQHGPVAIAVDAADRSFQLYEGGIVTSSCGKQLDHGVLLVGYGEEKGVKYWIVKNSWGASWGESGYIRLERGEDMCGIADDGTYPTGATTVLKYYQ